MRKTTLWAAVALVLLPAAVHADDPNDPAMRSAAARQRDREKIRQLNLAQLAMVRQRDAGYARGWAEVAAAGGTDRARADHEQAVADHARARARYEQDMAAWRRAVAACRAGDWSACDN